MTSEPTARKMFIAGEWKDASSGETISVVNPATEDVVATVPKGTEADAKAAADAAYDAKAKVNRISAWERYVFLSKTAKLLEEHNEEIARIIALEAGKPIRDSRTEARRAVLTFTFAAEEAKRIYGEVYQPDAYPLPPGNENRIVFSMREPIGVVVCISPFNFPLNLLCHKVAPALAAGNAVIAKPTSETPLVAIRLTEILLEAGCPKEAIQVITGPGRSVGNALVESPYTDLITFTGSTQVGTQIASLGGKRAKRLILEMGGMDPVIVKAFVNLLGIYPVGTFVVLDTFELAIVHSANPIAEMVSRPMVLIVSDDLGNVKHPGDMVDLAEKDEHGNFRRTIIKTADPERYGIRVGDYFI